MNISYCYANGNIHIMNENNKKRVIEYTDNFLDILKLENDIERIKLLTLDLDRKLELLVDNIKCDSKETIKNILSIVSVSIGSYIIIFYSNNKLENILPYFLISVPICFNIIRKNNQRTITNNRMIEGYKNFYQQLNIRYNAETEILKHLKSDNRKENEDYYKQDDIRFNYYQIDNTLNDKDIEELSFAATFYGCNKQLYKKLYLNGKLENELIKRGCTNIEINNIINLIEEDIEKENVIEKIKLLNRRYGHGRIN